MPDPQVSEGSGQPRAVPSEHRVFSLVLALVASPQGLTKRDVLKVVYGYSAQYKSGKGLASLERQFERDKEQLRELGLPIEAIDAPLESGNNQLTRYRIDKRRLEMPADMSFTPRELALLRLAAVAWSEGSLTAESRRSVMKLEALGAGLDVQHLGIAPSVGISSPVAPVLQRAITEAQTVTFDYQLPDRDAPLERHVVPLRLHRAEGRWHLIGHDLDRDADRVFLLSRIVGRVKVEAARSESARTQSARTQSARTQSAQRRGVAGRGEQASGESNEEINARVDAVIAELDALQHTQLAKVKAREGSQAETRLSARAGAQTAEAGETTIGTLDYRELAVELAGLGEQVTVLDPPDLRDDVVGRLRAVREQHAAAETQHASEGAEQTSKSSKRAIKTTKRAGNKKTEAQNGL